MKISSTLLGLVSAEWSKPSYYDFIYKEPGQMRAAGMSQWGHPVGMGNARHWSDCPALETPEGALGLRCNSGTCAILCPGGARATGRRRVRCRYTRKLGWYWKEKLGSCETCDVAIPTSNDNQMTTACKVNVNTGRKFCKMVCPADMYAADQNTRFVKVACKCPRRGKGGCQWYHRQRIANYQNYECNARAVPAAEATADPSGNGTGNDNPYAATTEAGATTAAATTAAATTAAATTAAATTAAPTTAAATTAAATTAAATTAAATTAAPTTAAATTAAATTAAATTAAATTAAATTAAATTAAATTAAATTAAPTTAAPVTIPPLTTSVVIVCPDGQNTCAGMDEVNIARSGHGASGLVYDSDLEIDAQAWAEQLKANNVDPDATTQVGWLDSSNDGSFGESVWIAQVPPLADVTMLGKLAAQSFYQQMGDYDHLTGNCAADKACDWYTQMMWNASEKFGIGIVQDCDTGEFLCRAYVVFRYTPAGNVDGEYVTNVNAPQARFPGLMSPTDFLSAMFG